MKLINDQEEFLLYMLEQKRLLPEMTVIEHIVGYVEKLNVENKTDYEPIDFKSLIGPELKQVIEKENLNAKLKK